MLKLEDFGANVPARLFRRCCSEEASQPSITVVHFAAANNFTVDFSGLNYWGGEGDYIIAIFIRFVVQKCYILGTYRYLPFPTL